MTEYPEHYPHHVRVLWNSGRLEHQSAQNLRDAQLIFRRWQDHRNTGLPIASVEIHEGRIPLHVKK